MEVFERLADAYVAGFVGSPTMNLLPGRLIEDGAAVRLDAGPLVPLSNGERGSVPRAGGHRTGQAVWLGIRPKHLTLGAGGLTLLVDLIEKLGSETLVHGRVAGGERDAVVVKVAGMVQSTETVTVAVQTGQTHVFDAKTGRQIEPRG